MIFALLLPWVVGPVIAAPLSLGKFVVGSGALALIVALWRPWIRAGDMRPLVPALGAAALLVNFLAAGGIGFPATAGSLWLLLGLSVGLADLARAPHWLNRPGTIAASLLACAAAVLGYATAYQPVIRAAQAVAQAEAEPAQAEAWLQAASQTDPLDEQPWARLTALRFARWQQEPTPGNWQRNGSWTPIR